MTLLVFALISIIFSAFWIEKLSNKIGILFSFIPLCSYLLIQDLWMNEDFVTVFVPLSCVFTYLLINKNKIEHGLKQAMVFSPWLFLLFLNMSNLLELLIFVLSLNYILICLGNEKTIRDKKLLQFESSNFVTLIIVNFFLVVYSVFVDGSINMQSKAINNEFYVIFQCLLTSVIFYVLGAFGSFSIIENTLKKLDKSSTVLYLSFKLVFIPVVFLINIKKIFDPSLIVAQSYMLLILIVIILVLFIKDLKRKCYDIRSFSISIFNLLNISVLYLFTDLVPLYLFVVLLFLNYICTLIVSLHLKNEKIESLTKLLFIATPLSPLFFAKIFYYEKLTDKMDPLLLVTFTVFLFIPLVFSHKFEKSVL